MVHLNEIRRRLIARQPKLLSSEKRSHAAVAMVLTGPEDELEVLVIERASHPDDPWSGNLAFPGGKIDAQDAESRLAAERETREEIGLELVNGEYLGRLDDIVGAFLPVLISCFVYHVPETGPLRYNDEVRDLFRVPLAELLSGQRHQRARLPWGGRDREVPAIDLLGPDRPVLWGITYRLLIQFFDILGHPLPAAQNRRAG